MDSQTCEQLANKIAELAAHQNAADYRLAVYIEEFDRHHCWAEQGATTEDDERGEEPTPSW